MGGMDVVMEEEGELRRSSQRQARRSGSRNNGYGTGEGRDTASAGSSIERGERSRHSHSRAQSNNK